MRRRLLLDQRLIPTGGTQQVHPLTGAIGERTWDDGSDRIGAAARFELRGGGRTIAVEYTDGYPVAQIFAPGQEYVCIEPMISGPPRGLLLPPVSFPCEAGSAPGP